MTEHSRLDHNEVLVRIEALEARMKSLDDNLAELLSIFNGSKKIVNGLGHFAVWVTKLGSTIIILLAIGYAIRHQGSIPNGVNISSSP